MKFTIPIQINPPSHQAGIHIRTNRWGKATTYKNERLAAFQQQFSMILRSEINRLPKGQFTRINGDYSISCTFYLKDLRHGDIDNMAKTIMDSCEGQLFENDRYCKEMFLYIFYDQKNPRVEIDISPLDCGVK